MDREQVLKWATDSGWKYVLSGEKELLLEFASLVRNAALEEAKEVLPDHLMPDDLILISDAIDSLKCASSS